MRTDDETVRADRQLALLHEMGPADLRLVAMRVHGSMTADDAAWVIRTRDRLLQLACAMDPGCEP